MKKFILLLSVAMLVCSATFATAISESFNPTTDGSVRQLTNDYVDNLTNMELRSYTSQSREIFLNFDLTAITITPQHATLRLYFNSASSSTAFIVSAYAQTGNVNTGTLTYTTRPVTGQVRSADIHASEDSVGKWLQFDFSDFIKSQDLSTNKLFSFRIVIASPSSTSPLLTIGSVESANKPTLVLTDAPIPGVYEVPYSNFNSFTAPTSHATLGLAQYAFDGSGLLPAMCHDVAADSKSWRTSTGAFPHHIIVKMNSAVNIKKFHIWNMNWIFGGVTDYSERGVKNMDIYISSSSDDLTSVTDFTDSRWTKVSGAGITLTRASGLATYTGEDVLVSGADNALWFAFKAISNFAVSGSYAGLSEVKVYKEIYENLATSATVGKVSNTTVSTINGVLSIKNFAANSKIKIFNTNGQILYNNICTNQNLDITLPLGFYIVNVNGESFKAFISK